MKRSFRIDLVLLTILICTSAVLGCLRVQPTILPPGENQIFIPQLRNETFEYGAEEVITAALVEEFLRDPRIRVVRRDQADSILVGQVTKYRIRVIDFDERQRPNSFSLQVGVTAALLRKSGEILVKERDYEASGVFYNASSPNEIEKSDVLRRLALSIKSGILEGW